MALKAVSVSTSVVLSQKEEIPSAKKMLRTTSQSFKRSSSLLEEAIQVHEKKEKELLSTIQNLSEENQKLREALETSEGAHQRELLIERKKIRDLTRGIESFSGQLKPMSDDIRKTLERILRCQDQVDLCKDATFFRWRAQQTGGRGIVNSTYISGYTVAQSAEILKSRLDPEYQARVNVESPVPLFAEETKSYARSVQGKLEMIRQEFGTLEETSKNIMQEIKPPQT